MGKFSANRCRYLRDGLRRAKLIKPRHERVMQRCWNRWANPPPCQSILTRLLNEPINNGLGEFLDEQWHAVRFRDYFVDDPRSQGEPANDRRNQLGTLRARELVQRQAGQLERLAPS